jgi:hypothetical protein
VNGKHIKGVRKMKSEKLILSNCDYDDITTTITFDIENGNLNFCRENILFEMFEDKDGNVEIYIPENKYHTGFYLKLPKNQNNS